MNAKLDHAFRFRDNEKFKFFLKIYTYAVLAYVLICVGFIFVRLGVETINNVSSEKVSTVMNFISVPLLLLLSFFRKNDYLFILAEFFTIFADMFLMLRAGGKITRQLGFTFFFIVQTVYAVYFYFRDTNKKRQLILDAIRIGLFITGILIDYIVIKDKFNYLFIVGTLYLWNLFMNLVCAIILKDPILIFSFGIFIISDVFIATRQFVPKKSTYYIVTDKLNHLPYLLSQVGLAFNKYNNDYARGNKTKK